MCIYRSEGTVNRHADYPGPWYGQTVTHVDYPGPWYGQTVTHVLVHGMVKLSLTRPEDMTNKLKQNTRLHILTYGYISSL